MKKAVITGNEQELNAYGYQLLQSGKTAESIAVFKLNAKNNPGSWNAYDSLGEALALAGDKKGARVQYAMALKKAPADQQERIRKAMVTL